MDELGSEGGGVGAERQRKAAGHVGNNIQEPNW